MDRPPCPGCDAPMIPTMIAARRTYVAHFVCVRFDGMGSFRRVRVKVGCNGRC